jgi:hypothetical protein
MKTLVVALCASALLAWAVPAAAQPITGYERPSAFGWTYPAPAFPYYQGFPYAPYYQGFPYAYPPIAYFPPPLPLAPSLGFGRGGIYGHTFVGRSETITGYTFPGQR